MKRFLMIAIATLLLLCFSACGEKDAGEKTTAATQAPTDAPYIDTQISEPEWTLAEGTLQLEDAQNIYADSEDILYFAIVTNADGTQELRFRMNDETANMLKGQSADNQYYITLNGERIGSASLSDDCSVAVISEENAAGDITELASRIRGLAE